MKIYLISYTNKPLESIASAVLNMGVGRDIRSIDDITHEEAIEAVKDTFKSHLDSPLEYASFNLFWEDIPLFLRAQLVRHRVGWGFAERSLRFYDANLRNPVENYDWDAMPTIKEKIAEQEVLGKQPLKDLVKSEMKRQMELYSLLLKDKVDQQDARNIIGVWYPTAMQTTCTFRALRQMLADRLSSQAHPFWQKAAYQIKDLITQVDPILGEALVDSCQLAGRCIWKSKYDRECESCVRRGMADKHIHQWTKDTTFGEKTQCECGELKKELLKDKN